MPVQHTQDPCIWELVQNRCPFLDGNSTTNEQIVSDFTLEMMHELEPCLRIEENDPPGTIGNEDDYTIAQRSLIADMVTCYILLAKALAETAGSSGTSNIGTPPNSVPANSSFLKKAKAGSVEVEFAQFDLDKNAGLQTNTKSLLDIYKKSAIRRATNLGCALTLCADCSLSVALLQNYTPAPFGVFKFGC